MSLPEGLKIKTLTSSDEDRPFIEAAATLSVAEIDGPMPPEILRFAVRHKVRVIAGHLAAKELEPLVVINQEGDVVATASFAMLDKNEAGLMDVATREDWRDRGLGRELMKDIETKARDAGATRIVGDPRRSAIGFYQKQGWYLPSRQRLWRKDLDID